MGIVLDSSVLIRLERTSRLLRSIVEHMPHEDVFISAVTASELLHGVFRAKDGVIKQKRSSFVEGVLERVPILPIDLRVARANALLSSELLAKGKMIGVNDAWIAATCLSYGYSLATFNIKEFQRIPGLSIVADMTGGKP